MLHLPLPDAPRRRPRRPLGLSLTAATILAAAAFLAANPGPVNAQDQAPAWRTEFAELIEQRETLMIEEYLLSAQDMRARIEGQDPDPRRLAAIETLIARIDQVEERINVLAIRHGVEPPVAPRFAGPNTRNYYRSLGFLKAIDFKPFLRHVR